MILEGYVKNKDNKPISEAIVEIKDDKFISIYSTKSDDNGYYKFDIPKGHYPFLIAVKDYAVNYLEYWCQNINLEHDIILNISFDTLEVYGLNVFNVKGANNGLMVYFRPMSLDEYKLKECDISPDDISIKVFIDDKEYPILFTNKVKELAEDKEMTAYLIQVEYNITNTWNKLDIKIKDKYDNYGSATIFNEK